MSRLERDGRPFLASSLGMTEAARDLRKDGTRSEDLLWAALRSRALGGRKFRRQQPIDRCIADFYCHPARLAVEVDGASHLGRESEDAARDEFLNSLGVRVLRLSAALVEGDLAEALRRIEVALTPDPSPTGRGE